MTEHQVTEHKLREATKAAAAMPATGVLVVEPDPDLQWRLARKLTVLGHRVVGTSSGDGALALLEQWPVDLVLVDEDLPGMSGLEVVRRVRSSYPSAAVILMTGGESPEVRLAARLAGVVGCLVKPFRSEALEELLAANPQPAE